jgi:hypothetical protein
MAFDSTMRSVSAVADRPLSPLAVAQVVAVVRASLASEVGQLPVSGPGTSIPLIGEADAAEFLRAVRVHRVSGVIVDQARMIGLPDRLAAALRPLAVENAALGLTLAGQTQTAMAVMSAAGIPALVMKGVPLSVQTTGSLTARGGGDVDLLIGADDVARAHHALTAAGWNAHSATPPEPGLVWSWTSRMRREYLFTGPVFDVDLHWRVGMHHRPLPSAAELIARSVAVDLGGVGVHTLAPTDALAAACIHVHLDRYARLRSIVDVIRLVRLPGALMPPDASVQWRRLVGEVVAFAGDLLGGVSPARLESLCGSRSVPIANQRAVWLQSSLEPIWSTTVLPLRELVPVYAERGRYSGVAASALMMATDFVLPPERLHPGMGPMDVVRALSDEGRDFVDRRLRRR